MEQIGKRRAVLLAGTGRLADDLYLMAHNDVTGRPYLQPRAIGLGLAGALLTELMLAGRIQAGPAGIRLTGYAGPPDRLADLVSGQLAAEREQHPVADWLVFLGQTAATEVAIRLGESGYLTRLPRRFPWRGERWIPADSDCAFVPFSRARSALDPARPLTVNSAALAGLAAACGLGPRLLSYAPARGRRVEDAVAALPPGPRYLIAQTQTAVDSAVLAHRV